ncbi:hypothetical protein TEQG_07886 [Trichophyton equinum CBS 127.97]|uniref:Uncharacterized protein n=1 Tax=Trichophyton equinum (strain ATCC MYA-4606 / CBS 127.97) TaxID=559882 RepID=F2Q463_TRIEC|nr:hypothetical protein TEQG_07886 [Trichophyton equinum CBS 127.97]
MDLNKRCGSPDSSKRKKQKTKHALRTKSASAPARPRVPRPETAPEPKAGDPLTKEALDALNKFVMANPSAEALNERESGAKMKLRYAPDYFTACDFVAQCEMQEIADKGGFDMSGLRIALHDRTHDYACIEIPKGDEGCAAGQFADDEEDGAVCGDDKDGKDCDIDDSQDEGAVDIEGNLAGSRAIELPSREAWLGARGLVLDTTADGRLELRPATRSSSSETDEEDGDPMAGFPTYFSDPANLDLNDHTQIRVAIEETAVIMKALFDRLQVLENVD